MQSSTIKQRMWHEVVGFCIKGASASLFAGVFFIAMAIVPAQGLLGISRYDWLFIIALVTQFLLLYTKLETPRECRAILIFHLIGFLMEVFKVSTNVGSWQYPHDALTKIFGVPLFAGFMYAAIGGFILRAWRLFAFEIENHPPVWVAVVLSVLIYLNFYSHHFIGDYRWYLAIAVLIFYRKAAIVFIPHQMRCKMPLILAFILLGFCIWLAENFGTFLGVWRYPNQLEGWVLVHIGKWSSWTLLVIFTFTIAYLLEKPERQAEIHPLPMFIPN